jgi:hypothetical protein
MSQENLESVGRAIAAIDVWESRAQFDRFRAERVRPAVAAAGSTARPEIEEFPVHECAARERWLVWGQIAFGGRVIRGIVPA